MGPRSGDRGITRLADTLPPQVWLQWGRDPGIAEFSTSPSIVALA